MAYHRDPAGGDGPGVITGCPRPCTVEYAAVFSIDKGKCGPHMGRIAFTPADTAAYEEILSLLRSFPAEIVVGSEAIQVAAVGTPQFICPFPHQGDIPMEFIPQRKHHERRMVAVGGKYIPGFLHKESVQPGIVP